MRPDRPARVLFLNHTGKLGGGELALVELIAHLDRLKIEPCIVLMSDGPLSELLRPFAKVQVMSLEDVVLNARKDVGMFSLSAARRIVGCFRYAVRLTKYLRDMQIDLVYTNSLKADVIGGLAARLCRIPLVWHVRDRIAVDYLPAVTVKTFQTLARLLPKGVITNSAATMRSLVRDHDLELNASGRRGHQKLAIVHDGVTVPPADYQAVSAQCTPIIGLVGRISPWKGQDVFLRAAAIIKLKHPTTKFQIIGSAMFGEEEFQEKIERLCIELGLSDEVEFTGFVRDVRTKIQSLTILVHASTTGEPFGQVIIEGMAAGKPVVATNGGGVPEIVIDKVTGLLVPMNDEVSMADAVCSLLEDPQRSRAMGLRALERVREHFTMQQTVQNVESVIESVLSDDRRPSNQDQEDDLRAWGSVIYDREAPMAQKMLALMAWRRFKSKAADGHAVDNAPAVPEVRVH